MFPTFTIYVTIADLTTLNAIFNGVAMICQQTVVIWGCASLASVWILLSTAVKLPIAAIGGNAQGVLPKGSLDSILPFIMAMLLTFPGFQSNIQVESTITNQVTVIGHVPVIISIIPVTGSLLSQEAGGYVQTAYQSTGTDYPAISATGNGFINPLKVLLASRSAVNRLNGIASEVDSVVTSCLGPDSGNDYAVISNLVNNAGNSGAAAAESIPIYGANPTALGALLYQASLSTNSYVATIGTGQTVNNCQTAAYVVADDIGAALSSAEFSRVVQGAVNGMDQPSLAGNTTIDSMTAQWGATRNSATINASIAAGSAQAQSEIINLLMGELVANELSCLSAAGGGRVVCESALVQANEIERNNIQLAAAEVPMLKYAGSFGNYLLALIIGLGPIMVMFMMFAGAGASKSIKTVAHLIAWPLLVTNVGAELINGMIYISLANFTSGIANGGYISQAENFAIYKELSFQVGSASHMMASLPVIMGMIFALGESAALVNVGTNIAPKGSAVEDSSAPTIHKQEAVFASSGIGHNTNFPTGVKTAINGAMPMINAGTTGGKLVSQLNSNIASANATIKSQSQTEQVAKDNSKTVSSNHYQDWGFTDSEAKAFREYRSRDQHSTVRDQAGDNTASSSDNDVSSQATLGVSGGMSAGVNGGPSVGFKVSGNTTASAKAGLHKNINAGHETSIANAKNVGTALEDAQTFAKTHNIGHGAREEIAKRLSAQQSYVHSLTTNQTTTDTKSRTLDEAAELMSYTASNISDENIAKATQDNADLGMYMNVNGQKLLNDNPTVGKNLKVAKQDAENTNTSDIIGRGREGALLFRAAQVTEQDPNASVDEKYHAMQFIAGALNLMTRSGIAPGQITRMDEPTLDNRKPANLTGKALPPSAVPPTTQSAHPAKHQGGHAGTSTTHPAAPHHDGNVPSKLSNSAANFNKEFDRQLEPGFDPTGKVRSMDEHARAEGLGADQEGTMVRTGRVVVGAAKDMVHEKGSLSPVNYGEGGAVEARQKAKEEAKKKDW
jgi:conjugal transfer mating pair stabilization protein TraG